MLTSKTEKMAPTHLKEYILLGLVQSDFHPCSSLSDILTTPLTILEGEYDLSARRIEKFSDKNAMRKCRCTSKKNDETLRC